MGMIKNSYVVLSDEDGWYHFYIHGDSKPNTDECIKSKYTALKNSDIELMDGFIEITGYEYAFPEMTPAINCNGFSS